MELLRNNKRHTPTYSTNGILHFYLIFKINNYAKWDRLVKTLTLTWTIQAFPTWSSHGMRCRQTRFRQHSHRWLFHHGQVPASQSLVLELNKDKTWLIKRNSFHCDGGIVKRGREEIKEGCESKSRSQYLRHCRMMFSPGHVHWWNISTVKYSVSQWTEISIFSFLFILFIVC